MTGSAALATTEPTSAAPPIRTTGNRLLGADLLRATAVIAVILIHATAWPQYSTLSLSAQTVMRFSVPAFVVLAGLVLGYRYRERPAVGRFLRRRLSRSLVPWLIWAPLYLILELGMNQIGHDTGDVLAWLEQGGGHLYFLLIIPQLYLLFLLWPRHHRWWVAGAAMALQLTAQTLRLYTSVPNYWWDYFTLWYGALYFPYWIGYFGLGVALGGELQPRGWRLPVSLAAAGALTAVGGLIVLLPTGGPNPDYATGTGGFVIPQMIPLCVGITLLLLLLGPVLLARATALLTAVAVVSRYSLGIYIIHPALLLIAMQVLGANQLSKLVTPFPSFVIFVALLLLISLGICRLVAMTPLRVMIGIERSRPRTQLASAA